MQGLEIRTDEYSDGSLMDEVTQLMLQAHDWDVAASGGREDPDVQVGRGGGASFGGLWVGVGVGGRGCLLD